MTRVRRTSMDREGTKSVWRSDNNEPIIGIRTTLIGQEVCEECKQEEATSRRGKTYAKAHRNGHRWRSA